MSKPTVESAGPAPAPPVYNPLSILAILGVGCAGLYALIVFMSALTALVSGTPLFLPDLMLLLPLAGAGLSLLAFRQIRNSEGTLSGETVARWGLWLSVLSGLGYGAYYLATGIAVQQQANNFLMADGEEPGFFPHLLKGEVNHAFLLTRRYSERQYISPTDYKAMARYEIPPDEKTPYGPLTQFAENDIVNQILQAGRENKTIQPLGVKSWKYERGEYVVERNYRIETEERTIDILITVQSNDLDAPGETRTWNVVLPLQLVAERYSPLGAKIAELQGEAWEARMQSFYNDLDKGKLTDSFENRTDWNDEKLKVGDEILEKKIRKELDNLFAGEDTSPRRITPAQKQMIPWEMKDGHIQFIFTFMTPVPRVPSSTEPQFNAEIQVILRSKEKVDPMTVTQPLNWEIPYVEVIRLRDIPTLDSKDLPFGG